MMDKRLVACATLCTGNFVCDVGTDHGYLPCYLISKRLCDKCLACDVAQKPLLSAKKHIHEQGFDGQIETLLSDGFDNVKSDGITDVVIAGMGGELISQLLMKCDWIKNEKINLVLQPMTKWDTLRHWLYENGFDIKNEVACTEGRFVYSVMQAGFVGRKPNYKCDLEYLYCGFVGNETDEEKMYLLRQAARLKMSGQGKMQSSEYYDEGCEMVALAEKLVRKAGK